MPRAAESASPTVPSLPIPIMQGWSRRVLLGLFVALMLVVPLAGLAVLALYTPEIRQETHANLQAIARLKAEQLENWLTERHSDAYVLMGSETISMRMRQLASGTLEPAQRTAVERYFRRFVQTYRLSALKVVRPNGEVLLHVGEEAYALQPELLHGLQTLQNGQIQRSNLYLGKVCTTTADAAACGCYCR